jgi:hypothetical protein
MTLIGGMGTLLGPVVGALVATAIDHYLTKFGSWVTVIQGAIFVLCVLAFRRGIVGEIHRLVRTIRLGNKAISLTVVCPTRDNLAFLDRLITASRVVAGLSLTWMKRVGTRTKTAVGERHKSSQL